MTQTVDRDDPILGFFHRWIVEFARYCESVVVICLSAGEHDLPQNVRVYSLGKEKRKVSREMLGSFTFFSRLLYLVRYYRFIWQLRDEYDAVFVHMNQIYVILGWALWRLMHKKVALWYTHKAVSWSLRLAERCVDIIFTASTESLRLQSDKKRVVGHGIDVEFFSPRSSLTRENCLLSVGRLMPTKRHDIAVTAAALAGVPLRIAGSGPEEDRLRALASTMKSQVEFLGPLSADKVRDYYQTVSYLIHTSETGSLDKVVLEAMACGLSVISTSTALGGLPIIPASPTATDIAAIISAHTQIAPQVLVEYVRNNHSLRMLIPRLLEFLHS